jgi:hypothetical protein
VRAVEGGGEVAVGQAEPTRRAELLEMLVDDERVVAKAPAPLLVDDVGEPERDAVGIDTDVQAVKLRVVRGVGDHRELGADRILEPGGELPAAGAAGEQADSQRATPSGRPRVDR